MLLAVPEVPRTALLRPRPSQFTAHGSIWKRLGPYLGSILILLLLWQALAWAIQRPVLPPPLEAFQALGQQFFQGMDYHLAVSAWRVIASLGWATLLGVPLGLYLGRNQKWDRWAGPLVYLTYPLPKIVFLPIILVLLGLGDLSKIFLIGLIIFFQILVTTRDAARGVPKELIYSLKSLGAGEGQIYAHVIFPSCLPKILTALRVALGTAIAVLFFSETIATTSGIGYYVMDAWARVAYDDLFAGVMGMGGLGFALYLLLDWAEKKLCPWEQP